MKCDACPAPAVVVSPGSDEIRVAGILLVPAARDLRWCVDCARLAGWPWLRSERGQPDMLSGDVA